MDWTLALAQDAIQQEEEQMAQMMYHQTSLRSWLFISKTSYSPADGLFFSLFHAIKCHLKCISHSAQTNCSCAFIQHNIQYTHILAYLPKICSSLYFSTIRTSPQDKYLVSAGGAGWLRCSLMSVSRSIRS